MNVGSSVGIAVAPWARGGVARPAAAAGTSAGLALAGLSGLAHAATFPPLSWSLLAWVALVPLFVACASLAPARAAAAGLCWTAAAAAGVAWFLPEMLARYFGLTAVPSVLAAIAVVGVLHGVWVSAFAAWVAWLVRRGAAHPMLVAGGWLAVELARGAIGGPWALTAYAQANVAPVAQLADLAGPYGIGMLVAAVNAGLAALLVPALRGRRPRAAAATIATAVAAALLYGQWRLGHSFAEGPAVGVAVVQGGASPADPAERDARLARYVDLTARGVPAGTALVVWPEHAVDAYLQEPSPARDTVLHAAAATNADLVLGGPSYAHTLAGTRYRNSAWLVRAGTLAARYDKHRLVPFAEDGRLAWLLGGARASYTPGDGAFVLPTGPLRAGTLLCLEAMYPDLARRAVADGADVLVTLSNDAWLGNAAAARHQLDIARLRAVETRRHVVRAAATGISAVVDPHGRTIVETTFDAHAVATAAVRASRAVTPYQRAGDAFAGLVIAAVAVATVRTLLDRNARNHRRPS